MRRVFVTGIISLALVSLVLAANKKADAQSSGTRIEADAKANVIRFIVDGTERAILDAEGLHVNGSIDYTGTITDGNRYSQQPPPDLRELP